jgi:hypothetical protein
LMSFCDPSGQVPSLEHNKRVIGESLDLIKYIDSNFDGPKLTITDVSSSYVHSCTCTPPVHRMHDSSSNVAWPS